jgi:hypothetical protein
VAIVALPEEMPVNESAMLERDITEKVGASVDQIFMNGLYPERYSTQEARRLDEVAADLEGAERAAVLDALREHRRAAAQAEQLARLEEMTSAPITRLPFLFDAELGVDEVQRLAEAIPV